MEEKSLRVWISVYFEGGLNKRFNIWVDDIREARAGIEYLVKKIPSEHKEIAVFVGTGVDVKDGKGLRAWECMLCGEGFTRCQCNESRSFDDRIQKKVINEIRERRGEKDE